MTSPFPKSSSSPGQGRIVVKLLPNNTSTFESITYQYPLKLISPAVTADQKSVLVFLLSYGGGLVGGDQISLSVDVQSGGKLSIVTQGHTKVFQSVAPDIITKQQLDVRIEAGAGLCLLPDPVQPFERSVYEQIQIFKLAPRASLCLLDWVTQGRSARGEDWSLTQWTGRNEVWATSETGYAKPRLLVRDAVILDGTAGHFESQSLRESMHGHAIFGTLILTGPMTRSIGEFFLSEFKALPRIGARDFEEKSRVLSELESWRARRLKAEKELKILWSAAHLRGCTVVKFGAATVEAGRNWIGSMLLREGTCEKSFGEQALMEEIREQSAIGNATRDEGRASGIFRGRGGAAAGPVATATPSSEGPSQNDAPSTSATGGDGGGAPEVISVSSTPTPSVQDGPSSRQSATPNAPSRGGGTRFKPKNVRRDAAERQRLEQERNRDLASKIKQEEREQRAEDRRARRGRGRGGAMSQRGFIRRTVTATGPFSAIPAGKGGWGWSAGPSRLHNIPHVGSTRYRPRREHETRVNIDVLSGFAEDVEDPDTHFETFRSGQKSGSLPMGLFRTEHQEEEVKVATTAELQAEEQQSEDEGDLFVDPLPTKDAQGVDIDMNDNEVWHAAPASAIKVKPEPGTEAADVDMSDIPEAPGVKAPPSPEQKKPAVAAADGVAKEKEKRREKALQDPEVQHAVLDAQTLLKELRVYKEGDEQSGRDKDGRMYLFQLPPILPPLAKPSPDGDAQEAPIDVDRRQDETPKVKREDGAGKTSSAAAGPLPEGGGCIGRLNVRRSGKVELDWGGTTLSLGNGTETEFLTMAVMLETREHPDNPEALTGVGYGMGQVMGKFVLTPVWDEEEDWEPSLEGLRLSDAHDENRDRHVDGGGGAATA
ncbi:hypothetical protein DL764_005689 [Monosporascus ibericus]|uniref:Urease accessory protein UreD n=1 Tax=Monosporascus ibericus TaxID=155417 RepID=A0A4Q4TAS7_9PEZI|nr:hypothetical protein DL764_005689 [Monosporascus ibericus]